MRLLLSISVGVKLALGYESSHHRNERATQLLRKSTNSKAATRDHKGAVSSFLQNHDSSIDLMGEYNSTTEYYNPTTDDYSSTLHAGLYQCENMKRISQCYTSRRDRRKICTGIYDQGKFQDGKKVIVATKIHSMEHKCDQGFSGFYINSEENGFCEYDCQHCSIRVTLWTQPLPKRADQLPGGLVDVDEENGLLTWFDQQEEREDRQDALHEYSNGNPHHEYDPRHSNSMNPFAKDYFRERNTIRYDTMLEPISKYGNVLYRLKFICNAGYDTSTSIIGGRHEGCRYDNHFMFFDDSGPFRGVAQLTDSAQEATLFLIAPIHTNEPLNDSAGGRLTMHSVHTTTSNNMNPIAGLIKDDLKRNQCAYKTGGNVLLQSGTDWIPDTTKAAEISVDGLPEERSTHIKTFPASIYAHFMHTTHDHSDFLLIEMMCTIIHVLILVLLLICAVGKKAAWLWKDLKPKTDSNQKTVKAQPTRSGTNFGRTSLGGEGISEVHHQPVQASPDNGANYSSPNKGTLLSDKGTLLSASGGAISGGDIGKPAEEPYLFFPEKNEEEEYENFEGGYYDESGNWVEDDTKVATQLSPTQLPPTDVRSSVRSDIARSSQARPSQENADDLRTGQISGGAASYYYEPDGNEKELISKPIRGSITLDGTVNGDDGYSSSNSRTTLTQYLFYVQLPGMLLVVLLYTNFEYPREIYCSEAFTFSGNFSMQTFFRKGGGLYLLSVIHCMVVNNRKYSITSISNVFNSGPTLSLITFAFFLSCYWLFTVIWYISVVEPKVKKMEIIAENDHILNDLDEGLSNHLDKNGFPDDHDASSTLIFIRKDQDKKGIRSDDTAITVAANNSAYQLLNWSSHDNGLEESLILSIFTFTILLPSCSFISYLIIRLRKRFVTGVDISEKYVEESSTTRGVGTSASFIERQEDLAEVKYFEEPSKRRYIFRVFSSLFTILISIIMPFFTEVIDNSSTTKGSEPNLPMPSITDDDPLTSLPVVMCAIQAIYFTMDVFGQ